MGWMDGWMDVKAILRIATSNLHVNFPNWCKR